MKRLISAALLCLILLLTSCSILSQPITEGEVYKKEYVPAYTYSYSNKIPIDDDYSITVPITYSYPERWTIYIQAFDNPTETFIQAQFDVSEEVYDRLEIGDWYVNEDTEKDVPEGDVQQ